MTGNIRTIRPAGAAIAAVLALSSPTLLAQTVTPPVMPEAAAPVAPQTPAAGPVFAPNQPVVQPTPSADERLNAAIAASEAETATRPAPVVKAAPKKAMTERRVADRPASIKAAVPAEPAAALPRVRSEPAPVETAPPAEPPAQPNAAQSPAIDPALLWALGGGVLLLLGLTAFAMTRRRNREDDEVLELSQAEPPIVREAAKPAPMPLITPPPTVREPVQPDPAMQGDIDSRLEAMVAAPPSPENPFKTYAKRMTRAKFLLAQQEKAQAAPAMTETAAPAAPRAAPVHTQTVYRFGSDRPGRKTLFNPRSS